MTNTESPLRPSGRWPSGRIEQFEFDSVCLEDNPLGDPSRRTVSVYLPHGYDDSDRHYPVLWYLAAYTSSGLAALGWRNHGERLSDRLDRLIGNQQMPPALCVMPDCYTALGGNQYVDSPAIGNYQHHLTNELIPAVDARFRTIPAPEGRAAFGKSSGGFGAIHCAAHSPGVFAAIASHAGDCGFDRVYQRDFPGFCDELALHNADLEGFVQAFWRARKPGYRAFHAMMVLCLAASYSPAPGKPLNLELPFDLDTCRLNPSVWQRWQAFDPVHYSNTQFEHLAALKGLWLDAGNRDQYFIHYGTRELHSILNNHGIQHQFELFDGNHSGMDWRFDSSLPWLLSRLKQD